MFYKSFYLTKFKNISKKLFFFVDMVWHDPVPFAGTSLALYDTGGIDNPSLIWMPMKFSVIRTPKRNIDGGSNISMEICRFLGGR